MLIDLDDTVISAYSNPGAVWLEVVTEFRTDIADLGPEAVTAEILAFSEAFWADPHHHRIWRQQLGEARRAVVRGAFDLIANRGGRALSSDLSNEMADRFTRYREERTHLFPGAIEAIDHFRDAGVLLGLITNGAGPIQRPKIERFGLESRFHHIQIEGEQGFGKPEERAYRHALQTLGVGPADAWMVGDNLEWEVAAPQRLGIYSVWHDHAGAGLPEGSAVKPDRIIRALSELVPLKAG
ncbi:MAG: HAD family hydrolase [Dehalococcoidia bacterium]